MLGPLAKSASVGKGKSFPNSQVLAANHYSRSGGAVFADSVSFSWANKSGYLGFKFFKGTESYFGWAHLKVTADPKNGETGVISSFAYDTVAGQTIKAGQTGSPAAGEPSTPALLLLALGALGLGALRGRKRSTVSSQPPANA